MRPFNVCRPLRGLGGRIMLRLIYDSPSERQDSNLRPYAPKAYVLAIWTTLRKRKSAARGNRTHTLLLVRDFKSRASTYSAIAAALFDFQIIFRTLSFCKAKSSWCEICKANFVPYLFARQKVAGTKDAKLSLSFQRVPRVILKQFVGMINIASTDSDEDIVVTLLDIIGQGFSGFKVLDLAIGVFGFDGGG